jgi:hypothetical protein
LIFFKDANTTATPWIWAYWNQLSILTNWSRRLVVDSTWNVWIWTTSPDAVLDVVWTAHANTWWAHSDVRYKKYITTIPNALEKVNELRWTYYYWKKDDFKDMKFTDTRQVWVIAQEIEKVLPEVVDTWTDGYKAVDYGKISAILIEAVKDLSKQNRELEKRLGNLENKLDLSK